MAQKPRIKSWSYSRLADFEICPYRAKLKMIDKIPEPERPLPPGKTEHANDRGTRIHNEIEAYLRGKGPFPVEAEFFRDELESLATYFANGKASLEGEWGFDEDWNPCDYYAKNVWLRVKCDAVVFMSKDRVVVIDYKTGRRDGNEAKHAEQTQLYALALMLKMPEVKRVDVELWYLDKDELAHDAKDGERWLYHLKPFNNRGIKMTSATDFPANPSSYSCKWCAYKEGICEYAYKEPPPVRRKK